jgi:ATP-dependent Lon protease
MEMIEFPGYIEEEKIEIARRFLLPRQIEEAGLDQDKPHFQEQALKRIVREYTYEAGVRNFEREIGMICRKIARTKAEGKTYPRRVTPTAMEKYLGPPQFFGLEAERQDEVGVAGGSAADGRKGHYADHRPDWQCDAGICPSSPLLCEITLEPIQY